MTYRVTPSEGLNGWMLSLSPMQPPWRRQRRSSLAKTKTGDGNLGPPSCRRRWCLRFSRACDDVGRLEENLVCGFQSTETGKTVTLIARSHFPLKTRSFAEKGKKVSEKSGLCQSGSGRPGYWPPKLARQPRVDQKPPLSKVSEKS